MFSEKFSKSNNKTLNNNENYSKNSKSKVKNNIINCFISNNKGKVILSRQFVELSKRKLFELAFLFDRNLNLRHNKHKNNFNLEEPFLLGTQEKLSFTHHPLQINNINLVLTTHISFNIFESLEIIKIIHRKIIDLCQFNSESTEDIVIDKVKTNAFEIIFSIDDIINNLFGSEEKVLGQLLLNYKMESKNADLFLKNKELQEKKTSEDLVKGIEEIDRLKRENKYVDNSVSSEMLTNVSERMNEKGEKSNTSLNLKDRLIQKLIEHREDVLRRDVFSIACDNMIKTMIMSEITRSYADRHYSDDEEYEDSNDHILMPLQIIFDSSDWEDEF